MFSQTWLRYGLLLAQCKATSTDDVECNVTMWVMHNNLPCYVKCVLKALPFPVVFLCMGKIQMVSGICLFKNLIFNANPQIVFHRPTALSSH